MLSIDTNVLVRILVDDADSEKQCTIARQTLIDVGNAFISQVVQIETAWVLMHACNLDKTELKRVFEPLIHHPMITLQSPHIFKQALDWFVVTHADFADCMILAESKSLQLTLATFDKKLARQDGCKLLL